MSARPWPVGRSRPPEAVLALSRLLRRVLIALVLLYRNTVGLLLAGNCRFQPTCSQYALDVLRTKPAWRAIGLIVLRIARCHPLCKGGHDPAPVEIEDEWYLLKDKG